MSFDNTETSFEKVEIPAAAPAVAPAPVKSDMTIFVEKLFKDEAATHLFIKKLFSNPETIRALTRSFVSIYDMFSRTMQRATSGRFMDMYQVTLTTEMPSDTGFVEVIRKDGVVSMGSNTPEGTYLEYQNPDAELLEEVTRQYDALVAALPVGTTLEELAEFRVYGVITQRPKVDTALQVTLDDDEANPAQKVAELVDAHISATEQTLDGQDAEAVALETINGSAYEVEPEGKVEKVKYHEV